MNLTQFLVKHPDIRVHDIANSCGLSITTLYKYVNGDRMARLDLAQRIVEYTCGQITIPHLIGTTYRKTKKTFKQDKKPIPPGLKRHLAPRRILDDSDIL